MRYFKACTSNRITGGAEHIRPYKYPVAPHMFDIDIPELKLVYPRHHKIQQHFNQEGIHRGLIKIKIFLLNTSLLSVSL